MSWKVEWGLEKYVTPLIKLGTGVDGGGRTLDNSAHRGPKLLTAEVEEASCSEQCSLESDQEERKVDGLQCLKRIIRVRYL
jgi:hypothetical protein